MGLPTPSNDATWFEVIIAGASAIGGGIVGGAIGIWQGATWAEKMRGRVENAEGQLDQLAKDMAAEAAARAKELKAIEEKLEQERAARFQMFKDHMEMVGIVRREVVTTADKLREDLTDKIDRIDERQERRDVKMGERIDKLTEHIMGRPQ